VLEVLQKHFDNISGGSCDGCGDDQCPAFLQNSEVSGVDGNLFVAYTGSDVSDYRLFFFSPSNQINFLTIKDFFPKNINYSSVGVEDVPYTLDIGNNIYLVDSVDNSGSLNLQQIESPLNDDGYLNFIVPGGLPFLNSETDVHFGTSTETFNISMLYKYLNIHYI
jgi:hypothetical protein